jgi:phage tail-like protein
MARGPDWLAQQLPVGMVEDEFLVRFLRIFQDVADTVIDQVDNLPHMFDASVAPPAMVRALGGWIGLDWVDPSTSDRRQRAIVRTYFSLLRWRGTKRGMRALLELITEGEAIVEESGGIYRSGDEPVSRGHVLLRVATTGPWATEDDLLRIVRSELPASVTFELFVGDRQIWPVAAPPPAPPTEVPVMEDVS